MNLRVGFILCAMSLCGCGGDIKPDVPNQQVDVPVAPPAREKVVNLTQNPTDATEPARDTQRDPKDAQPNVAIVFRLECYQIKVPLGAISRNEDFWKRLNEQCVRQDTYDLLFKNGFRVGTAPFSEWDAVKNFIQQNPGSAQTMATVGAEMKNIPIEMKKNLLYENIFAFDQSNELVGQTFERCDNLFNISFQKAPRKYDEIRLSIAPTVRSTIKRIFATALNNEWEFEERLPTSYYLGLTVDIPVDSFVVLAPSSEAMKVTSLGKAFLVTDEPAEQSETVLVVLARPFRMEQTPTGQ